MLITTNGCEGCSIMRNSIKEAISRTQKENIQFKEIDHKVLLYENNSLYSELRLRDFPTTVFIKDNKVVRKEVGTRPTIVILRWIDIDFK